MIGLGDPGEFPWTDNGSAPTTYVKRSVHLARGRGRGFGRKTLPVVLFVSSLLASCVDVRVVSPAAPTAVPAAPRETQRVRVPPYLAPAEAGQ